MGGGERFVRTTLSFTVGTSDTSLSSKDLDLEAGALFVFTAFGSSEGSVEIKVEDDDEVDAEGVKEANCFVS
jgi:hypothetical protein